MGQKVNRLIPCPLGQYALSVSTNPEKLISLIVRMRTNRGRGSTVILSLRQRQPFCSDIYDIIHFCATDMKRI